MRKLTIYLISILIFFHTAILAYSSDPKDFISELVNQVISKLSDKNLDTDEKKSSLKKLL